MVCYNMNLHKVCYDNYTYYSKKMKKLDTLVKTQYPNKFNRVWVMFKMLMTALYLSIWQYLNRSVQKIGDNKYIISYVISGQLYKFHVKLEKGPGNIIFVTDNQDNDITDDFKMFYGPMGNFHGNTHTPCDFNKESLTIVTHNDQHQFDKDDIITF